MNGQIIAIIILISLLVMIHASAWIINWVWRLKNFRKGGLHTSTFCFMFLGFSTFSTAFLTIGGFTFLDNGTSGVKCMVFSLLLLGPLLLAGIKHGCYCIYIEDNYVVEKKLFSTVRINLKEPGTTIYDPYPHHKDHNTIISSPNNDVISFNFNFIEGNRNSFIDACVEINSRNKT
jgi:hypothetical protein